MCPDKSLLSAYYDKEVGHPWDEKIKSHLKECPVCQAELDGFSRQSALLNSLDEPQISGSFEQIELMVRHKKNVSNSKKFKSSSSKIMPLAAAAAAIFAFFLGFWTNGTTTAPLESLPVAMMGEGFTPGDTADLNDNFTTLASYLGESDESLFHQESSLDLPVNFDLSYHGDSQLLKSVDYNKGGLQP